MTSDYLARIASFTESDLPDLDEVVLASLQFLSNATLPQIDVATSRRPLVVGSVNALRTARMMFSHVDAVFAEEGNYEDALARVPAIDAVYVVSASGGKHAIQIAQTLAAREIPVFLITNNAEAPARAYVQPDHVFVFPHLREPYTYNTSTYMSMLQSVSHEPLSDVINHIETVVMPAIPTNLATYTSFILTVEPQFEVLRGMFETKFDELFGSLRYGRAFTSEEMKHAKTIVPSSSELYIDFGVVPPSHHYQAPHLTIPVPDWCGPVGMLAIGYYVIGYIQKQNQPFFKENIAAYTKNASGIFGQTINSIVE